MLLQCNGYGIELESIYINQLISENKFKLNGRILEKNTLMFEFEAFLEDEEIIFDVYYTDNSLVKIYVDETYEIIFRRHFKTSDFEFFKIYNQ
jgi:hypothetical protein